MNWAEMTPRQREALVAKYILYREFEAPRHGSCCTCQNCGHHYEDCSGCEYTRSDVDVRAVESAMRDDEQVATLYWIHLMALTSNYKHAVNVPWVNLQLEVLPAFMASPEQKCRAALQAKGVNV